MCAGCIIYVDYSQPVDNNLGADLRDLRVKIYHMF